MRKLRAAVVVVAILPCLVAFHSYAGEAEDAAMEAADNWLTLVDSGDYSKSWDGAAELFKNAITEKQWEKSISAARKPLGDVMSRTMKSSRYATSLPGAPDGEYVVIQFETTFANKKSAVESVTPMKDPDGTWRVSGYYIK